MKKILMPVVGDSSMMSVDKIYGGVERFQNLVYNNIGGIIPVYIDKNNMRATGDIINQAVEQHKPDMIFCNHTNASLSKNLLRFGIKIVYVHHEPIERSLLLKGRCEVLLAMFDNGADVYFVSELQYEFFDSNCKRLCGRGLGKISGFIRPAFAIDVGPLDVVWDVATIGRCLPSKDPFWVHRKLKQTDITSLVMSSNIGKYRSPKINDYIVRNNDWSGLRTTQWNLCHSDNMNLLMRSGSFVSTWPLESFGITALEALNCGVPVILLTSGNGKHASESIATDSSHIVKLQKSNQVSSIVNAIKEFGALSMADRITISESTKKFHSKEKWIDTINDIFDITVYNPFQNDLFSY